jgi:hypothetical protein
MLRRDLLLQQNKLNLLNTISLRIMPLLAGESDYDGLVQISMDEIKEKGYMTKKLVPAAIEGLLNLGLLRKSEDGKLYNLFSCHTESDNKGFYYINLYKFFSKDIFKSMYKSRIKLLFYLISSKIPGTWHSVAVEKLYRNKSIGGKLALEIFKDFDDLMGNLIPLVTGGLIEIKLGKETVTLSKKTPYLKEKIYSFCGKSDTKARKKRTRGEKDGHVLHIRVSDEVLKEKTTIYDEERRSTLKDLGKIASKYDYSLDVFSIEALQEVNMVKHKIYKEFGNLGITIYREALETFFEHNSHSFARHMNNKEFGRVIKNHYVVPRINMELRSLIKKSCIQKELSKTEAYLRYFSDEAYLDNLVTFDNDMKQSHADYYNEAKHNSIVWKHFADKVEAIYQKEAVAGNGPSKVLELAMKGVLTGKKRFEFESNTKKNSNNPSEKPETPKEINEFKARLRERGLLLGVIRDIECDF